MKLSGIITILLITALIVLSSFNLYVALAFWLGMLLEGYNEFTDKRKKEISK